MQSPEKPEKPDQPVDGEIISQFLALEMKKAQLAEEELKLRAKEMDNNSRFAEKSLDYQAEYMRNSAKEFRKTFRLRWLLFGGIAVVVLSFLGVCVCMGKEDFALKFLQIISYVATTFLGYYFGRKSVKPNDRPKDSQIQTAEILP